MLPSRDLGSQDAWDSSREDRLRPEEVTPGCKLEESAPWHANGLICFEWRCVVEQYGSLSSLPSAGSLLQLLTAAQQTGAAGCDQTNLLTWHGLAGDGGGVAHVLVISSSVRMLHGVHGRTTHLRPAVPLHPVLVVVVACLQDRLVHAAAAGNNPYDSTAGGRQALAAAGGEADTGLLAIVGVAHNHAGCAGGPGEAATIRCLLLAHGDHGTLRHLGQRQHVADGQLGLGATVHKLSSVATLHCHPQLLLQLVAVGVMECHLANGRTTSGVVHDLLDKALDVTLALGIVHGAELHGTLVFAVKMRDLPLREPRMTRPMARS